MRTNRYPASNCGHTRLNGRLRLDRGGAGHQCHGWPRWSSALGAMEHGGQVLLALNGAEGKGILTQGSITVGWAPRWLTAAAGFVLLLGSVHGSSKGPPVKVRAPTRMTASPRAHRGLQ
jgi:hypothetical protein